MSLLASLSLMMATLGAPPASEVPSRLLIERDHPPIERLLRQSDFRAPLHPRSGSLDRARAELDRHRIPDDAGLPPAATFASGPVAVAPGIYTVGDLIVMEGDSQIVTHFGGAQYGLRFDNQVNNATAVTRRLYEHFPDEFDFVVVWTSFWDYGAEGLAYYAGIRQDTRGTGQPLLDNGIFWGSKLGGRLQGFLNMKSISLYGDIGNPQNFVYSVMGQEITHRWLAFMKFRRPDGTVSNAMLGRDQSHWSSLLQANGSVQDGNSWLDLGDGSFRVLGSNFGFSQLDLYGIGMAAADEVPPWFLIENAVYQGQKLNGLTQIPQGFTIQGTRTDIGIDDVISAHGMREPNAAASQKEFRVATILITEPGQPVTAVGEELASIQLFGQNWEKTFAKWTLDRGSICSKVSADCDSAALALVSATVVEADGDGDGSLERGEHGRVDLTLRNAGSLPVTALSATLPARADLDISPEKEVVALGELAAGETRTIEGAFRLRVGPKAPCSVEVSLEMGFNSTEVQALGKVGFDVGFQDVFRDGFESDAGWLVGDDGADTATAGAWERATPIGVNAASLGLDLRSQPGGGRSGAGMAFVTGAAGGDLGAADIDNGVTTLTSPVIALAGAADPVLRYWSWHVAVDLNTPNGQAAVDLADVLSLEISGDGGSSWTLVDEDASHEQRWRQREFRLLDVLGPALPETVRLRFRARDLPPQSLSEAAIDDVRIFDAAGDCTTDAVAVVPDDAPDAAGDTAQGGEPDAGADADHDGQPLQDAGPEPAADAAAPGPLEGATAPGSASSGCSGGPGSLPAGLVVALMMVGLLRRRLGM
ncbi:MAG: hypothetical protein R3F39_05730 [Myxococcota bacterium]